MKVMIVKYQGEKNEEEVNKLYDTLKEKIQNYGFIIADQTMDFETVEIDTLGKPESKKKFYDNMEFPEGRPELPKPPKASWC